MIPICFFVLFWGSWHLPKAIHAVMLLADLWTESFPRNLPILLFWSWQSTLVLMIVNECLPPLSFGKFKGLAALFMSNRPWNCFPYHPWDWYLYPMVVFFKVNVGEYTSLVDAMGLGTSEWTKYRCSGSLKTNSVSDVFRKESMDCCSQSQRKKTKQHIGRNCV